MIKQTVTDLRQQIIIINGEGNSNLNFENKHNFL